MEISPEELSNLKNTSNTNYKKLCQQLLKMGDSMILLKAAITILRDHPSERQEFEVSILEKATEEMGFFKQLKDEKAHQRCCKLMTYRYFNKNEIIFREGDPSTEFFIILDGSVNVYKQKSQEKVAREVAQEKHELKHLSHEEKQKHASYIVEHYQPPKMLQRRLTISLNAKQFSQYLPHQEKHKSVIEDSQNTQISEEVEMIRKLTFGLEKIPDKSFMFQGGVFLLEQVAKINDGQMFGERGIMIESKRTGTVITTTPLHVAVLTKSQYKSILEDNELEKIRKKNRLLTKSFLSNLTYKEIIENQYLFIKKRFPMGHVIYKQDEPADEVFIIIKGTVKLYKMKQRQIIPMYELSNEQVFGEAEYFEKCNRICNVQITSTKLSCYGITYTDLLKIFVQHPHCESLLLKTYNQKKNAEIQRFSQQAKAHRKLNSIISSPNLIPMNRDGRRIYEIGHKFQKQRSMMEFIQETGKQLKQMKMQQKLEMRKEKKDSMTLADTLIQLEKQSQQIKKDIRRQEQRRFSCIIEQPQNRSSSISSQPKYQSITEQMLFNCKSQQYEIEMPTPTNNIQNSAQSQNSSILISSKHNLFRSKPRKHFLMSKYERRTPKSSSQDVKPIFQ